MPLTYPAPPPVVDGDIVEIHHLLQTPTLIARRLRTIAEQRYIADALLRGRFTAVGGAIMYETGETIEVNADPEGIAPGGAYPQTTASGGDLSTAKTTKWGEDVPVTDEAIARLNIQPVDRALTKLVNTSVRFVDSAALGVVASKVTNAFNVTAAGNPGAWTGGDTPAENGYAMVAGILLAKAQVEDQGQGYDIDTIVLGSTQWAKAIAMLIAGGYLPREAGNPVVNGNWPETLGLTWLYSPHTPSSNPMLLDTQQLGGMADENLGGPGYSRGTAGVGVETKVIRDDDNDQYKLRGRRVTVPVVLEPAAGVVLTNTGL